MTEREALELIAQTWKTGWATLHPGDAVPFALEDEKFRPPAGTASWALVFVRHTTTKQLTQGKAGTRRFEHRGNVIVFLFGAANQGRGLVADLVADVRTIFQSKHLTNGEGLWTEATGSVEGGPNGKTTDGAWWCERATTPFRYYAIG